MICTDAAAEGINLQFCWIMINYDVPWNPARLEQRMGRIHRYGQKHDPVHHPEPRRAKTREGRVLKTLLDKLEKIRKQLKSDKVFDCIGRIFEGVSIKQYMEQAVAGRAEASCRELDGQLTKEQVEALAEREKPLYGDGGDVKKELPRLRESIEQETFFRLLPGYVRRFISSAAPLVGIEIDGDLGGVFRLTSGEDRRGRSAAAHLGDVSCRISASCLTVVRPKISQACVWMHPGEPVFERFRELVRDQLGERPCAVRSSSIPPPRSPTSFISRG